MGWGLFCKTKKPQVAERKLTLSLTQKHSHPHSCALGQDTERDQAGDVHYTT